MTENAKENQDNMQEMTEKTEKHKTAQRRNDWYLIGIILLVGVGLLVVLLLTQKKGKIAVVSLNGNVILEQSLEQDCQIPIQTEQGYNLFQVQDGTAIVAEADCRDQICVNHTAVSKKGESIVCLPHGLVIEIQ